MRVLGYPTATLREEWRWELTINRNGERQCEWCGELMPNAFKLAKTCSSQCRSEYQRDYFARLSRTPSRRAYQRDYQLARYHRKKASAL